MAEALSFAYFDTSALVKRYVVEEGSVRSDAASWSLVAVAVLPFVAAKARQAAAARAVGRDVIDAVADRPISRGP